MRTHVPLLLALMLTPLPHLAAQQRPPRIEPGAVVRMTAPTVHVGSQHVIGTLLSVGVDTILLRTERESAIVRVPITAVQRVQVWDSTATKSASTAILISGGLAATAVLGAVIIDRADQALPSEAEWLGVVLLGTGLTLGPSAPSFYAGRTGLALAHLGISAAMATGFLVSLCLESCTPGEDRGMLLFFGGYALNWLVGTIDGAMSAKRYRRWVDVSPSRIGVRALPLSRGRFGVGLAANF